MHKGREVVLSKRNSLQQKMGFLNLVFQTNRIVRCPLVLYRFDCHLLCTPSC